jgi:hypothetical protein
MTFLLINMTKFHKISDKIPDKSPLIDFGILFV